MQLLKSFIDGLGYDLPAAVEAHKAALEAHRFTEDEPAPVAEPIVEAIVRAGGYAVEDDTPPPYEPPPPSSTRSVAMWRARTIMKVTPWSGGTLFQAVQTAIAGLENPLQRATAEEALERGDIFDRDGIFVPMLMQLVGVSDDEMDTFMEQAAGLPA